MAVHATVHATRAGVPRHRAMKDFECTGSRCIFPVHHPKGWVHSVQMRRMHSVHLVQSVQSVSARNTGTV